MSEPYNVYQDIRQYVTYDADGRILVSGSQGYGFLREMMAVGVKVALGGTGESRRDSADSYVDSGGGIIPRPLLGLPVLKFRVTPRAPVLLNALPKAAISYSGPLSGKATHDGGSLSLAFAIPGTYEVSIEAFPCKPTGIVIEVVA